jgi:hypothetical protein
MILVSALAMTLARPAAAGVYLPADPKHQLIPVEAEPPQPMPYRQFHDSWPDVLAIGRAALPGVDESKTLHGQYLAARDQLLHKGLAALSAEEVIDLSGRQIRLRDYAPAEETLRAGLRRFDDRFELFANLAAVKFQQAGRDENLLNEAVVAESAALRRLKRDKSRPADQVAWLVKAEGALLKLMQDRLKELKQPPTTGRAGDRLDELFPETVFADPNQRDSRAEATAVVQQLLYWFPDDTRLFWQLGELYRADSNLEAAKWVYEECVYVRAFRPELLWQHRGEVRAELERQAANKPAPADDQSAAWWPSPERLALVGGAAGLVLFTLIYLQWRNLRRKSAVRR